MHLPPCLFSRKTAALKTTHSNVSCSCRGLPKRGEREGVEEHRAAWPCNEAHRTTPGYFEGAGSTDAGGVRRCSSGGDRITAGTLRRPSANSPREGVRHTSEFCSW